MPGRTGRRPGLVYTDDYDLNLGTHVFPSSKYRMIHDNMVLRGLAAAADFEAPRPATDEEILLAHGADWVDRLKHLKLRFDEIMRLEIPVSPELVTALWLACGGSIRAAERALEEGVVYNVGGGFHHAFRDHGEGFCGLNDVAVAIRRLQKDGRIRRAMVVDVDVHQGNGTAGLFADDPDVFTLSIHQLNNYPYVKPPSSLDINLEDGTRDEEYLARLSDGLLPALDAHRPELLFYVAGADPYEHDRLGGLALTRTGLRRRDDLVLGAAVARTIPTAIVLAGGYATDVNDTVAIHVATFEAAQAALRTAPA